MTIRPVKLPDDLDTIYRLIIEAFQYPENPEWNIDSDEVGRVQNTIETIKRVWPLYRAIKWMSPSLRDALLGFIWEEAEEPVGLVTVSRRGSTDSWFLGNVGVLPKYRRRGIARKLVKTGVDFIQSKNGNLVILDVVAGNFPAYNLYQSLGFEHYTSTLELKLAVNSVRSRPEFPAGYTLEVIPEREWEIPMEMAKSVVPEKVQAFDPISKERYYKPTSSRLFFGIMNRMRGIVSEDFLVRDTKSGKIAALGFTTAQTKPGDKHFIRMNLSPEYSELAPFLIQKMLYMVNRIRPDHAVQSALMEWRYFALKDHQDFGFEIGKKGYRMGLQL